MWCKFVPFWVYYFIIIIISGNSSSSSSSSSSSIVSDELSVNSLPVPFIWL